MRRKQIGAWYTPSWLVEHIVDQVVARLPRHLSPVSAIDLACGDGRFLAALRDRLCDRVVVTGVDVDRGAIAAARTKLGDDAELVHADALGHDFGGRRFDVVVGNPPFLSQMAAVTSRNRRSDHGGGLYADAAVEFLALSLGLAQTPGSQVALVVPASMLSTRDAAPIRARALQTGALEWFWWSRSLVFAEANVRTCVFGWVAGSSTMSTSRTFGESLRPAATVGAEALRRFSWASLIADQLGVPALPERWSSTHVVGEIGASNANFRDEYYGLVGAVAEAPPGSRLDQLAGDGGVEQVERSPDDDGLVAEGRLFADPPVHRSRPKLSPFAPLITSGLIDPGRCSWGQQSVRFNKVPYRAPVVDLAALSPRMQRWAHRKRVPKVLLANQTRVIEAVVDVTGHWLPSVPVVNVRPLGDGTLWHLAAALSNPVTSAVAALQGLGAGLSASSIRLSAPRVADLPIPSANPLQNDRWSEAASMFADSDVIGSGLGMLDAYEIDAPEVAAWWVEEINRRQPAAAASPPPTSSRAENRTRR